METKLHDNGIVEIIDGTVLTHEADDIFNLFFLPDCSAIIIKKENIAPEFFNLASGIAGEILQKFSNYRKRLAIIGDFGAVKKKALQDFIRESNAAKQILFVKTTEEAVKIFNS